jgi:ABC-type Mn2+/Zn2+ transport system ATPase subunit
MTLDPRRTVLVGRNGAGKTLLLEGLYFAAHAAILGVPSARRIVPPGFECEIVSGERNRIGYRFAYTVEPSILEEEEEPHFTWTERCWRIESGETVWEVEKETLRIPNQEPIPLAAGVGFMSIRRRERDDNEVPEPQELGVVRRVLLSSELIGSGNVRGVSILGRDPVFLMARTIDSKRRWQVRTPTRSRIGRLAAHIANMHESSADDFREFVELMRKLGLVNNVKMAVYGLEQPEAKGGREAMGIPKFDGVDIGDLSDGTLRVAEIILGLTRSSDLLLIEEPELAVHPGLLGRLLEVVDSYSVDRQVVVSTHSPQVVSWCLPSQLRFVRRENSTTTVHTLDDAQVERVCSFISDEGTLGEYVFTSDENE